MPRNNPILAKLMQLFRYAAQSNAPDQWREDMLNRVLRVALPFGIVAYVFSMIASLLDQQIGIAVADTLAIVGVVVLHVNRQLSFRVRAFAFAFICYGLGTVLLITVGPVSQIYLLGFSVFTTLLLGLRIGLAGVVLNGVTLLVIGFSGIGATTMLLPLTEQTMISWIAVTVNFLLVNSLLVLAVGSVINSWESALKRESQARSESEHGATALRISNEALEFEVDERRRTESALATSEERFRLLSRATSDAIWDWDLITDALWCNDGFAELIGFIEGETVPNSTTWKSRIHESDLDHVLDSIRDVVAGTDDHWASQFRYRRNDGEYVYVAGRGHVVRDPEGKALRMIGGMTDMTEKRKLEQQFLRSQRMESIGTLAGGIAHDLNNILAPILMSTELLPKHITSPDGLAMLERVRGSAQRGADLVRQVLGFARGIEGVRKNINPAEIVRDLYPVLQDTFPRNIAIDLTVPESSWIIHADPIQLDQILMNLCVNARDAMPDGGHLSISLENMVVDESPSGLGLRSVHGPHVLLRVTDTGTGMTPEIQENIFEPFFTTKALGKGTGLGLSTSFSIIRDHRGTISLQSEPGKGSSFTVYLPAITTAAPEEEPKEDVHLPRGNGELILLVDDEELIRDVTGKSLKFFGYRVVTACNGADALDKFLERQDEVAAVLTDISMPIMDGPTMIEKLRATDPRLCIIATSGLSDKRQVTNANGGEPVHFVSKPYTAEVLLKTLDVALRPPVSPTDESLTHVPKK